MTFVDKNLRRSALLAIVPVVVACAPMGTAPAHAQTVSRFEKNQTINITYGRIVAVEGVRLDSAAAGGAAMGGVVGLATTHGGDRKKFQHAAAGALLGGILTKVIEGSRKADAFTVQRNDGSALKIIQDLTDLRVGDCVSVEQGQTANLRRVSDEMCSGGAHHQDAQVQRAHSQSADDCQIAKDEVLKASSDAEFARAERKVRILCH